MFGFGYGRGFSLGRVSSAADSYKGILDLYPGAVAGYSVFKLTKTATNSIRVRRTFDDTEQDIGFDSNGNLDTTSLLNFVSVNNPIDSNAAVYTSDFRSEEDLGESKGSGSAPESVADVDDAYKFTLSGGSGSHYASKTSLFDLSSTYTVSLDYYIPSGQTVDAIQIRTGGSADGVYNQEVTDAWTSVTIEDWTPTVSNALRIYARASFSNVVDANDDVFYLKNIRVEKTIETPTAAYSLRKATSVDPVTTLPADQAQAAAAYSLRKVTSDSEVTTLPGDQAQAAAAYSLRKVKSDYDGSAIRVRRSSDDTEQDIGFDSNGDLDTTALNTFVNEDVEKIVNGDFTTDTDWTKGTGWTISGGAANCDGTQTSSSIFKTAVGIDIQGVEVTFSFEVKNYSAGTLNATIEGTGTLEFSGINANGVYSATATSSDSLPRVTFTASSDFVGSIDDVSVIQTTADGAVTTWYDQSGNNNNATNSNESEQPLVVSGGTLVEENGKAAIEFDGVDDSLTANALAGLSRLDLFFATQTTDNQYIHFSADGSITQRGFTAQNGSTSSGLSANMGTPTMYNNGAQFTGTTRDDVHTAQDGHQVISYIDADTTAFSTFAIGVGYGSFIFNGKFQELIAFNSDQSSNRKDIEWEINNYYSIFDNWDRESAIRVRRSSDDTEQDIGFDANGDLDTTALLAFVGGENRFENSDPSSGDFATLLNSSTSANDWGLSSPSFTNKTILDKDLGNALAYPRFDEVETGETYTISAYVKIVDGNSATFGSSSGQQGYLNLRGTAAGSPSDYTVTNVTGDIYRISATIVAGSSSGTGFLRWTNANAGQIEITGFQIVKGSTLTDYVETSGGISGFGYVTTWYDQSGNNNHATNSNESEQPLIVDGGTLVEKNGKTAINFDGVDDEFVLSNVSARSFYAVLSSVDGSDFVSTTQNRVVFNASTFDWQEKNFSTSISYTLGNQALLSFNDSTSGIFSLNGVTHTSTDANPYNQGSEVFNRIGANDGGSPLLEGTVQELILFDSDQSTNRNDIEWEINNYYSIFDNWDRESAIRVRRTSDDTEQDIGFDANGDLDTTALTTFVNADVTQADTDFSTGFAATSEGGLDRLANQSIGGRSGVLKGTIQATTEEHRLVINGVDTAANTHRIQTSVYIPSGQSGQTVDGFRIENGGRQVYATTTTKDAWVDIDVTWTSVSNINVFIKFLPSGGAENWTGNGTDEVYIGDVTITQTTADGAVTTWYDQSGNSNHATNSTESEQPLVVNGGTLVEENGKAAIEFDGVDDNFDISNFTSVPTISQFNVLKPSATNVDETFTSIQNATTTDGIFLGQGNLGTEAKFGLRNYQGGDVADSGIAITLQQYLIAAITTSTTAQIYANGVSGAISAKARGSVSGNSQIGANGAGGNSFSGKFQELIIFDSDQSSTREDIEKSIGAYYGLAGYGDGAVTTWYDQSGNNNHATNSNESEQPLIVDGGSMAQFDGINAIEFNGTSHELAASLNLSTTTFSSFNVAGTDGTAGTSAQAIFGSNGTAFYSQIRSYDLETRISSSPVLTLDDDIGNNPNQMQLFTSINGTSQGNQYIDGTIGNRSPLDTSTSGGINETTVYIGSANGQRYLGGGICEIILFASDQSSNRTGIEENINSRFNIY